jgi:hypothetical protein
MPGDIGIEFGCASASTPGPFTSNSMLSWRGVRPVRRPGAPPPAANTSACLAAPATPTAPTASATPWPGGPGSVPPPANQQPCSSRSRAFSEAARRWTVDDRDHLADLPQLRRRLRAARRPRPQAGLLLPGLPASRLPRPPTDQRRSAQRPPGLALRAPRAAPSTAQVGAGRRRPAPAPAPGQPRPAVPPAPTAATQRQRPPAPAPPVATTWRASGASSPPCCARPPPPPSRTRRPPAGRRLRPCASSWA